MKNFLKAIAKKYGFQHSLSAFKWDLLRAKARSGYSKSISKNRNFYSNKLHLGCGLRKIEGWLNVDLTNSDFDVDIASTPLPFPSSLFDVVVSQQVIEHLRLESELVPLFSDLHRIMRPGAWLWLSCPDMAKICRSYSEDRGQALLEDRLQRYPESPWRMTSYSQGIINFYFHQCGEHKNIFDYEMLAYELDLLGFSNITRSSEHDLLQEFREIPPRGDEFHSLYIKAHKSGDLN